MILFHFPLQGNMILFQNKTPLLDLQLQKFINTKEGKSWVELEMS